MAAPMRNPCQAECRICPAGNGQMATVNSDIDKGCRDERT